MTEIASHRGGALLWAENSRLAFEQTAKLPVEVRHFERAGECFDWRCRLKRPTEPHFGS